MAEADAEFKVDLDQPGIGDGVKYGINIPKEVLEKLWVDPEFPPYYASLGLEKEKAFSVCGRLLNYAWCPISYCKPDLPLFAGTIDPTSLGQGALGDCWLITAISTMAEYPESLKKLFVTKEHNEIGQYVVQLYSEYELSWINFKLDSFVPIDLGGGLAYEGKPLIYVNPSKDAVWMCFLEKAIAKYFGSYAALNGNMVSEGWKAMTGCTDIANYEGNGETFKKLKDPFDVQQLEEEWGKSREKAHEPMKWEEFFKLLNEFDGKNYLMCSGITPKKNPNLKENMTEEMEEGTLENGLYTKHAYAILGTYEGHGVHLVRCRNPWGTYNEYNGDWCDKSSKWKDFPEVAKAVNFQPRADGVFWMTAEDFCANFTLVQVLKHSMPGPRAVESPYEAERAEKIKAEAERLTRIKEEIYENGGWYTGEAVSWRGGEPQPGMRIYEDPEMFEYVANRLKELWELPNDNLGKDFSEHAKTKLPPVLRKELKDRQKAKLPKGKASKAVEKTAAGSGLGAVRALAKEEKEEKPTEQKEEPSPVLPDRDSMPAGLAALREGHGMPPMGRMPF